MGNSKSHSVKALVFKPKETAKFHVCGMKSISVAWKHSVDRSAVFSRPQKYKFVLLMKKESLEVGPPMRANLMRLIKSFNHMSIKHIF